MSLDLYNLADKSQLQQVFYASGNWVKPRGVNMVEILCVGAGGGGGRGVGTINGEEHWHWEYHGTSAIYMLRNQPIPASVVT